MNTLLICCVTFNKDAIQWTFYSELSLFVELLNIVFLLLVFNRK